MPVIWILLYLSKVFDLVSKARNNPAQITVMQITKIIPNKEQLMFLRFQVWQAFGVLKLEISSVFEVIELES